LKQKKNKTNTTRNGQFIRQKDAENEEPNIVRGKITRIVMNKRSVALKIMKIDLNFNPKSPIIGSRAFSLG